MADATTNGDRCMGQSRTHSILEAAINSAVAMGYAVIFYGYIFGFTFAESIGTTAFFAVAGFIRVFIIRRIAESISNKRDGV